MYKMSSGADRLAQEIIITINKYSKNKILTICVNKKGAKPYIVINNCRCRY